MLLSLIDEENHRQQMIYWGKLIRTNHIYDSVHDVGLKVKCQREVIEKTEQENHCLQFC